MTSRRDATWRARCTRLAEFRTAHGRPPRAHGTTEPDEHQLALWLRTQRQRHRAGRLETDRAAALAETWPDWAGTGAAPTTDWDALTADIAAWRTAHGRLPRRPGPGVTGEERRLGTWLGTQRNAHSTGALPADRIRLLDDRLPGWDRYGRRAPGRNTTWQATADDLADWLVTRQRPPARRASPATSPEPDRERRLANWVHYQRSLIRAGACDPHREAWLYDHCEQLVDDLRISPAAARLLRTGDRA